jgi:Ca2+/H+ antiporter
MSMIRSAETDRLQRHAGLAAWACRVAALAIPVLILASWAVGEAPSAALTGLGLPADHGLTPDQWIIGAALSVVPALALSRSLFGVAACFDGFALADWFGAAQPLALAIAGRWLVISGILALVVPTLLGLALTLNAEPGARVLAITLSSNGILALLFGTLLWALGRLWTVARNIAAENAQFV